MTQSLAVETLFGWNIVWEDRHRDILKINPVWYMSGKFDAKSAGSYGESSVKRDWFSGTYPVYRGYRVIFGIFMRFGDL